MIKAIKQLLLKLKNFIQGNRPPDRPRDPYAGVPVRNRRGPNNRNSAVALAEPDEE